MRKWFIAAVVFMVLLALSFPFLANQALQAPALPPDAAPAARQPTDAFSGLVALSTSKASVATYRDIAGRSWRALRLTAEDSPLSLPLDGRYSTLSFRLVEAAGQAKRAGVQGAVFAVAGDGEILFQRKLIPETPLSTPEPVELKVSGVRRLELALSSGGGRRGGVRLPGPRPSGGLFGHGAGGGKAAGLYPAGAGRGCIESALRLGLGR